MRAAVLAVAFALLATPQAFAQAPPVCHVLCTPKLKVEPTVTFTNLFGSPRIIGEQGTTTRERRETEFEVIVSIGLPTRAPWLEFTLKLSSCRSIRESTPELEFEVNFIWLPPERTRGWVSSHFDIVDKFSAAERPTDRRAYTHKLNFELDTSLAVFNRLPEGHWLRGVELEGSLDYVATGLPKKGDRLNGARFAAAAPASTAAPVSRSSRPRPP